MTSWSVLQSAATIARPRPVPTSKNHKPNKPKKPADSIHALRFFEEKCGWKEKSEFTFAYFVASNLFIKLCGSQRSQGFHIDIYHIIKTTPPSRSLKNWEDLAQNRQNWLLKAQNLGQLLSSWPNKVLHHKVLDHIGTLLEEYRNPSGC